jgi:UDP-2,4-diacetamido-2,4,6-trideoxy-beta-L-altropyranose hydrolase
MGITLRPARREDEDLLRRWRNDPVIRRAASAERRSRPTSIMPGSCGSSQDPDSQILVIEERGRAVGQIRLDRIDPDAADVSIGLASEARGRGIGRAALALAAGEANRALGVRMLRALVKEDNVPSLRAFVAAGFAEIERAEGIVALTRSVP